MFALVATIFSSDEKIGIFHFLHVHDQDVTADPSPRFLPEPTGFKYADVRFKIKFTGIKRLELITPYVVLYVCKPARFPNPRIIFAYYIS